MVPLLSFLYPFEIEIAPAIRVRIFDESGEPVGSSAPSSTEPLNNQH
jgi:hypothetical protein